MIETLTIFQWTIISLTALCIGMSKTGVQGMMLLIVPYMAMAFDAQGEDGVHWHQCVVLPGRQLAQSIWAGADVNAGREL